MYSLIILLIILIVIFDHIDRTPVGVELFTLEKAGPYNKFAPKMQCGTSQLEFNCVNPISNIDLPSGAAPVCMTAGPKVSDNTVGLYGRAAGRPRMCI
jgi:hypothetical protein